MKKIIVILVILNSLFPGFLIGQNYYTRNFTMQNGMPSNSVRSLYTASDGLLWIGTDAGLCRFDGKKFNTFSQGDGFTGNKIWSITEDENNNMWFGDYGGGLWRYDGKTFTHYSDNDGIVNNAVRSLYYSKKWKLLFIGTQFGLTVYDGNKFQNFDKNNLSLDYDPYIMGFVEKDDQILIYTFTDDNLVFDPQNKTLKKQSEHLSFYKGGFFASFQKSDGNSILSYRNGIVEFNKTDTLSNITTPTNSTANIDVGQIFGFAQDQFQNVWMASWEPNHKNPGGLFLYDGDIVEKKNNILGKDPLSGWCIHYDGDNNILWFGTLDMGLFMIQESIFEYIDPESFGLNNLKVNDIKFDENNNPFLLDEKNLVITYSDKSIRKIPNKLFFNAYSNYLFSEKIIDNRCRDYTSFEDILEFKNLTFQNDTVVWIMSDPGLFRLNLKSNKVTCHFQTGYGSRFICVGQQNQLFNIPGWGYYGIFTNIESEVELTQPENLKNIPKDISEFIVHENNLWLTSWSSGLFIGRDSSFVNYNSSNSSICNSLNALCFDNNGNPIIGSNSGEVYFAKPSKDSLFIFKIINETDGLLGNSISWMETDIQNFLWVGTNLGLNRIDMNNLESDHLNILNYDKSEGYIDPNVNVSAKDRNGIIWLGSETGLCKLNIKKNEFDTINTKKIKLTSFEINGKPVENIKNSLLDLKYNENYLQFNFDVINFINPEKDRFRYFLEGVDMDWSEYSDTKHVIYPDLQPGKYTLRIEGINLQTGSQYSTLILQVNIYPPFWMTWWFIGLIVVILTISIIYYFRYRIDKTKKEEQKKAEVSKQLAELEMKALLVQMNPHFTFNAINSIQNYILDNDVDTALTYLSDFSKIIRQTLENASKDFITLAEEIDFLKRYLHMEKMRFDDQFEHKLKIEPSIDADITQIPPMVLQPYVENAIKHGLRHKKGMGKLIIQFSIKDVDVLLCTIEDNGIGRKASKKINSSIRKNHNGAGMNITKTRIGKLNEVYKNHTYNVKVTDLYGENNQSLGTRIEIFLPLLQLL
ncbi:MAG: histidine kinase [Bacteroidales bacterium]|nr:histidine kinase [Bacteroidales bacterium]